MVARMLGLTLLEMALVLVVVGLLVAVGAYTTPWINEELQRDQTRKTIEEAGEALVAFATTHHRLPCPDTNDNGYGDCGAASGTIPHAELLLDAPVLDHAHRAVAYSVYRRANAAPAADSDLARLINRFDAFDEPAGSENVLDFCAALKVPVPGGAAADFTSTSTQFSAGGCAAGNVINQAFVVASYGTEDRDGAGTPGAADGDNGDGNPVCYSSPLRGRDASFDDIVLAMEFTTLAGRLCP